MLKRASVNFRIPHRLLHQFPAAVGQPAEPAAVVLFRGCLFTDRLPLLWRIEVLGGEGPEFFVSRKQRHLPVANLRRLLLPAGDLVVDPEGMISRTHHQKQSRRAVHAAPPRQVVLGKHPHLHHLRPNAAGCWRECPDRVERFNCRAASGQQPLTLIPLATGSNSTAPGPQPFHAHVLHAKIVRGLQAKPHRLCL